MFDYFVTFFIYFKAVRYKTSSDVRQYLLKKFMDWSVQMSDNITFNKNPYIKNN